MKDQLWVLESSDLLGQLMISFEKASYYEAAQVGLSGNPPQVTWSKGEVIWHEQHGDYAAVLAITDSYRSEFQRLYLLLRSIGGEWFPAEQASDSRWLPYEEGASKGVLMDLSHSAADTTQRVRAKLGDRELEVQPTNGHLCFVLWDVERSGASNKPEFSQVKIDDQWVPCVVPSLPVSAQQFGDAYLKQRESECGYGWADDELWAADWEDKLKLVMAVVQQTRVSEHENALGSIGAGPLEDMMSDWLLDRLEAHLPFSEELKYVLTMVRMDFEPEAVQRRLGLMLATSGR